jgi:hypothetical protein
MKQLGAELTNLNLKLVLPDVKAPALNKAPALKEEPALKKDDAVGSLLVPEPTRMQLWPPTRVPRSGSCCYETAGRRAEPRRADSGVKWLRSGRHARSRRRWGRRSQKTRASIIRTC